MGAQALWRDNATLFRHDVDVQPRSARLRLGVASLDYEAGRSREAEQGFERALGLYPGYPDALLNLATLARERRDLGRMRLDAERRAELRARQ